MTNYTDHWESVIHFSEVIIKDAYDKQKLKPVDLLNVIAYMVEYMKGAEIYWCQATKFEQDLKKARRNAKQVLTDTYGTLKEQQKAMELE